MDDLYLEFTLKQHTPIIHFQPNERGATLRATEVKAKLDKFIWQKEWSNDYSKGKMYLVGYSPPKTKDKTEVLHKRFTDEQFRALDYKISFSVHQTKTTEIAEKMPLYFGNMSSEPGQKKEKHFVTAPENVSGFILCTDSELLKILKRHLAAFFQTENFGTRQSKGFGSFGMVTLNGDPVTPEKPSKYYFTIANNPELQALWEHIDLLYRSLRSGINLKGAGQSDRLYFKSLMFQYAKTQQQQWDKRKIRLDLFGSHPRFQQVEQNRTEPEGTVRYNNGEPMLYRDMLGLSSSQSWLSYKATVNKTAQNPEIDRFKSPITFKPFRTQNGWEVYIIPHQIPDEMKGAAFNIEADYKKTILVTPDFNLESYLKFAFGFFKTQTIEDYVGDHAAPREVRVLSNIYQQLSKLV